MEDPMTATDHELMQRSSAGDAAALAELVRRWEGPVCRLLARLRGSPRDAEDLSQEVFLRVLGARDRYRAEGAFSTWLYRIATNVVRDTARRDKHRTAAPLDSEPLAIDAPSPADAASRRETGAMVEEALAALDYELREALALKHYGNLTFAEVAEVTGLPVSTVKSRVRTALDKLGHELRRRGLRPEEFER